MITIALDEQGDFENLKGNINKEPVFIGGVVYDDLNDSKDYENEKKRLKGYLKKVCGTAGCAYPSDMHSNGANNDKVRLFKIGFSDSIKEFLENGTFGGEELIRIPRKGHYHIFAILRGERGKENLLGDNISAAVRDDFASNLYIHMADDVVSRLIFHNPVISEISRVRLELATRRTVFLRSQKTELATQYEVLGYRVEEREDREDTDEVEYLLTNPYSYRTAIEREMLYCDRKNIEIDRIGVKSIYYKNEKNGMDFLYLADAVCSYLGFEIGNGKPHTWLEEFSLRSEAINATQPNIIWAYDDIDEYFAKAQRYLEDEDYYRAFSVAFDGRKFKNKMAKFYAQKWFKYIDELGIKECSASAFSLAIKKYSETIYNNNVTQEKLVYIYEELEKLSEKVDYANNASESILYDLYDSGVSAYTHIGKLDKARKCFELAQKYSEYVPIEKYLRTRNKMVVFYMDEQKFSEALKLADENVTYHELLSDVKKELYGEGFSEALNHAIAHSQRGQVYAAMNDERAEEDFLKALEVLDPDTPDRYITMSYLLHYYIFAGLKDKYQAMSIEYFGGRTSLNEQFDYLVREGSKGKDAKISLKFAFFVYIKALYCFYSDTLPKKVLNKLKNISASFSSISRDAVSQINGHPWELSYKYIILILLRFQCFEETANYKLSLNEQFNGSHGLINSIYKESVKCIEATGNGDEYKEKYTYMYV